MFVFFNYQSIKIYLSFGKIKDNKSGSESFIRRIVKSQALRDSFVFLIMQFQTKAFEDLVAKTSSPFVLRLYLDRLTK